MNGVRYDDWSLFLEQRGEGPKWHWPLNLAVALHLAVFSGAAALQSLTAEHRPRFDDANVVTINLLSLSDPGSARPATPEPEAKPAPPPKEPVEPVEVVARKTKEPVARPETKPQEPIVREQAQPKPEEPVVQEQAQPELARTETKPEPAAKEAEKESRPAIAEAEEAVPPPPAARTENVVSLAPLKQKVMVTDPKLAERRVQEARTAEAEKEKKAVEARRKLAEETRKQEELARREQAVLARRKLAEQEQQRKAAARIRRMEREAAKAKQEAAKARDLLAAAIREEAAVSSVVSGRGTGTGAGTARGAGSDQGSGFGLSGNGSSSAGLAVVTQYAAALNGKISSLWKLPEVVTTNRNLKTIVALTVGRNGAIEDMKIERKSGDPFFDQSVMKALRGAEPLPDFPPLITASTLEFELNFTPQGLTL